MGDILKFKKPKAADKVKGKTLCKRGFHKWAIAKDNRFDTNQGRLITTWNCERCGVVKTRTV